MPFTQATIPVENTEVFGRLKDRIEQAMSTGIEKFLKGVGSAGLLVRQYEEILDRAIFDRATGGKTGEAKQWYAALSAADQGQIREFYLTRLELVDDALRAKFNKVYRYS
ncbi:MAG: hypothetical protein HYX26_04585 [Acidobacteriales bacterium]|nr:hypothetical protein [Terriglobales bacterium]